MFNPYHYRKEDRAEDDRRDERKARHHQFMTDELAAKARTRLAATLTEGDPNQVEAEPTYLLAGFHESRTTDNPRRWDAKKQPHNHSFRDRDASKDISHEKFDSKKWKYEPDLERCPKTAAKNANEAMHVNQPKYQSPGMNCRHAKFSENSVGYALRERNISKEKSDKAWSTGTKGWKTERDRVDKFLDDYAPRRLGESLPDRLPKTKMDSTKPPEDKKDFVRYINRKDCVLFRDEIKQADFNVEDFKEKKHPEVVGGQPFRAREPEKEIKHRSPIRQRIGFNTSSLKPAEFLNRQCYTPL